MNDQVQPPAVESMTSDEAQGEIQRLSSDKEFTAHLLNAAPYSPAHREALGHWRALQAKAHGSGQAPAGGDESAPTKPHPTNDYVNAAAAALEAPATPDEYKITRDDSIKDWDNELESEAKQLAHVAGLSGGDLEGFVLVWNNAAKNVAAHGPITQEQSEAAGKKMMDELRQKHGAQAGDIINKARSVINGLPAPQRARVVELLELSGLGNSAFIAQRLALLAERKAAKR